MTNASTDQVPNNDFATSQFIQAAESILGPLQTQATLAEFIVSTGGDEAAQQDSHQKTAKFEAELVRLGKQADKLQSSDPVLGRKLDRLRLQTLGVNADEGKAQRRAELRQQMDAHYANSCAVVDAGQACKTLKDIDEELRQSRNALRLQTLWQSWYDMAAPQRARYDEYIALAHQGALDSGYRNAAEVSLAAYEVKPEAFDAQLEALWEEVKPLYVLLHAYVRARLAKRYGSAVDPAGPIPMHLVGNLWGQDWEGILDIVLPEPKGSGPSGATDGFAQSGLTSRGMVAVAERFFESLGFTQLPPEFEARSYFVHPLEPNGSERPNFQCHASAWNVAPGDWRLRVCFRPSWADFLIAHHEAGHIFYFQQYDTQPYLFRDNANAGISEAVGDAVMLSVTPGYLEQIGLSAIAPRDDDLDMLMRVALRKVVRIPFGLALQRWRWGIQSGAIPMDGANQAWWQMVRRYQGLAPAVPRPTDAFDPAAKYHVAIDMDYVRYFLADVLTFQIHDGLARTAGCTGPLHRCSIYGNARAGEQLRAALAIGASRPWQEVLERLSASAEIRGEALLRYLQPLQDWLVEQTRDLPRGWAETP